MIDDFYGSWREASLKILCISTLVGWIFFTVYLFGNLFGITTISGWFLFGLLTWPIGALFIFLCLWFIYEVLYR